MLEKSRIEYFVKNEENSRGNVGGNSMEQVTGSWGGKGLVKLLEFEIKYRGAENLGIKLKKILEVIKGGLMSWKLMQETQVTGVIEGNHGSIE